MKKAGVSLVVGFAWAAAGWGTPIDPSAPPRSAEKPATSPSMNNLVLSGRPANPILFLDTLAAARTEVSVGSYLSACQLLVRYSREFQPDLTAMMEVYQECAAKGYAPACYFLGVCYERGLGTTRDLAKAVEWIRKGMEAKDEDCLFHFAYMLEEGVGVPKDPQQAMALRQSRKPNVPEVAPKELPKTAPEAAPRELPKGVPIGARLIDVDFSQVLPRHRPAPPPYPPMAKIARIQGTVVVEVVVGRDGVPIQAYALEGPIQLRDTAINYVLNWRFQPCEINGCTSLSRFRLTMPFTLH